MSEVISRSAADNRAAGRSRGKTFGHNDVFEPHIDYLCPQCGKEFTEKKNWGAHVVHVHGMNKLANLAHIRFKSYALNFKYKAYARCRKCHKCFTHREDLVKHLVNIHRIGLNQRVRELQPIQQPKSKPIQQPKASPIQQPEEPPIQQPEPQLIQQLTPKPIHQPEEPPIEQPEPQPIQQPSKQTVTVANETFEITFLDEEPKSIERTFPIRKLKAKAKDDRSLSPPPPPPNSPTSCCYKCKECGSLQNSIIGLKMHLRRTHFICGKYNTSKYITAESAKINTKERNIATTINRKEDSSQSTIPAKTLRNVQSTSGIRKDGNVTTTSSIQVAKKPVTAVSTRGSIRNGNIVLTTDLNGHSVRESIYPAKKLVDITSTKESMRDKDKPWDHDLRESINPRKKLANIASTEGSISEVHLEQALIESIHPAKKLDNRGIAKGSIREGKIVLTKEWSEDYGLRESTNPAKKLDHATNVNAKTEQVAPKMISKSVSCLKEPIKSAKTLASIKSKAMPSPTASIQPSSTPTSSSTSLPAAETVEVFLHICPACGDEFKTESEWRRHINEVHKFNKFQYLKMRIRDKNLYQCLLCRGSIVTSQLKPLQDHHFRHLRYRLYVKCTVCETSYNYKPNVLAHLRQCTHIVKERRLDKAWETSRLDSKSGNGSFTPQPPS